MGARMIDIARDLGVSLMTVSKALRHHSDISEGTRARVLQRAQELEYRPNWIARSLVTRRTYVIGLVIPDLMSSFFAEVSRGVTRKIEPLGYHIFISNSDENADVEQRQIELLLARSVDGLIIASAQPNARRGMFGTLSNRGVPYVLIDRIPPGLEANFVGAKDEEIGALATTHLIERGRRRIAHIRGPALPTAAGRLRGYHRALAKHSIEARPDYVVSGQHNDVHGYEAMRKLLALHPPPDGVVCYNDPVAAGAVKAVLEAGLRVPADVAIIGAGNVHYSDLLRVPLSTIDQSSSMIGETAAELLVNCIEQKTPAPFRRILIPLKLVVRESTAGG
jgi:LacI family transcriptional regulator